METLAELEHYPLDINIKINIIKYWLRIISLPDDHILKQSYDSSIELDKLGFTSWATSVRFILQNNGFGSIWEKQTSINILDREKIVKNLGARLKDQYVQLFHAQIFNDDVNSGTKNKLQFYRNFKLSYSMENYLNYVQNFNYRRAFSRLRLSNHTLRIETGRYVKEVRNERLCIFCDKSEIENETHMLLYCPLYSNVRNICFDDIEVHKPHFRHLSEFAKLQDIMNPGKSIVNAVTKFVHSCFNIRKLHV